MKFPMTHRSLLSDWFNNAPGRQQTSVCASSQYRRQGQAAGMEQAQQERLQTALKNLLDCVEEARQNPNGTSSRPRLTGTGSSGPAAVNTAGNNPICGTPSGSAGINTVTNRPSPLPTVNNEMQRSFPGLFLKKQGKRRFQETKSTRKVSIQFFLLPEHTDRTPKGAEELRLLQAGLGRRVVSLPENSGHKEIISILEEEYHKMKQLAGGWLCYKAAGGCGQRKLTVVPPESEGYTTKSLKAASSNGKITLYIVPLQDTIDSSPLPPHAAEFEKMPKSVCKKCGVTMPLQVLALHIENCAMESDSASEDSPDEDIIYVSEEKKSKPDMELCPVCGRSFPEDMIEFHASMCVDNSSCSGEMEMLSEWRDNTLAGTYHSSEENATSGSSITRREDATAGPSNKRENFEDAVAGPSNRIEGSEDTVAGPSNRREDWKKITDPKEAADVFKKQLLSAEELEQPLRFILDLREDMEEQDREVISFYKRPNVNWARPFSCILRGDAATGEGVSRHILSTAVLKLANGFRINFGNTGTTLLFEGEPDHLVPSTSQILVDSDLFLMAGRIVGHSFIQGGPCLSGISPAVIHILLGRPDETATIQLKDCPDLDHRSTIQLLEGDAELSDQDKKAILDLALSWDLPGVTNNNRHWLFNRLLHHAVLGRTIRQIKQFRRGLKDTKIWSLLQERPDVVHLIFPRNSEAGCCAQIVLNNIIWPAEEEDEDDDDDDAYSLHIKCRIAEYLRSFIESACVGKLQQLVKFWVGWELPTAGMKVKVVRANHPKSSTCFQILRLPGHYSTFQEFSMDLQACIATCDTGFGLI